MSQQETQIKDISHSIGDINFQLPILLSSEKHVRMRMVGDVFTMPFDDEEIKLTVVPNESCVCCFFAESQCLPMGKFNFDHFDLTGYCSRKFRTDDTSVIFKEIPQNKED